MADRLGPKDIIEITIDRLSVGGRGVGRTSGLVVFVTGAAPGETLEVELTSVKKNFAEAKLKRIVRASPHRIEAPCPVFGICGGCTWQHVSYEEQLRQKREIVRSSLAKFSGFDVSAEDSVEPTVASPNEFRYRNRIQLHRGNGRVGFTKRGSHDIVDIDDCPITEVVVSNAIRDLRSDMPYKGRDRVEIFLSEDGDVKRRGGSRSETADDGTEEHTGPAFAQVNRRQNDRLIEGVVDAFSRLVPTSTEATLFDLYAGNGNFTFPLAKRFTNARLVSVELNAANSKLAKERAEREFPGRIIEVDNVDVAKALATTPPSRDDVVLLDPPRTGCDPIVMRALVQAAPKAIVYVSCHPVTLSRDLRVLRDAGWKLSAVRPYDMFPQTDHVEALAVLTRE